MPMIHVQRLSVVIGLILVCASSVPPPDNNTVASRHNGCIGRHQHGVLGVSQPFFIPLRQECFLGTTYYGRPSAVTRQGHASLFVLVGIKSVETPVPKNVLIQ